MRALQRPCTQILLYQSCYSFEKMSQAFSEMQSSMFDSKSCCLTHPASLWRPIAACACTHLDTRAAVSFDDAPVPRMPARPACGISRRGGRALRRRTVVLRRDCSWLTCEAEAEGDCLGDLEETWRSRLGSDLAANLGQRAFSRAYPA